MLLNIRQLTGQPPQQRTIWPKCKYANMEKPCGELALKELLEGRAGQDRACLMLCPQAYDRESSTH